MAKKSGLALLLGPPKGGMSDGDGPDDESSEDDFETAAEDALNTELPMEDRVKAFKQACMACCMSCMDMSGS